MTTDTMHFFAIDTLKFSKRLQNVGLDKNVADELAEAIAETGDCNMQNIASKGDIKGVKKEIKELESRMDLKMDSLKKEIIIKIGGLMFLGFGTIIALLMRITQL